MKKSLLMCLAVLSASCSLASCGKKADYVVGISQFVTHDALDAATKGFKDALTEAMTAKGKTVEFDYQNAAQDVSLCSTIAANFVSKNVNLIMANATPSLQAAYNATQTIPILGTSITDYGVALKLENYNGTVGGNVSGTSDCAPLTTQADMIKEIWPDAKNVGLFYCSAEANSLYQVNAVKARLQELGITGNPKPFAETTDLQTVLTQACAENDVIYIPTDNTCAAATETILGVSKTSKTPVFAGEEGICKGCGVATLSISYYNLGLKTGKMAAEILLEGKDISTMPIAYDENPVKKYNKTLAEEFKVTLGQGYTEIK